MNYTAVELRIWMKAHSEVYDKVYPKEYQRLLDAGYEDFEALDTACDIAGVQASEAANSEVSKYRKKQKNMIEDGENTMIPKNNYKGQFPFDDFSGCEVTETPFEYHGTKYVDVCVRFDGQEIHYEYRLCDNEYEEDYNEQD